MLEVDKLFQLLYNKSHRQHAGNDGPACAAAYYIYNSVVFMLYFWLHECQKVTDSRLNLLSTYNYQTAQELDQGTLSPVCNSFLLMSVCVCMVCGWETIMQSKATVPPQDTTMSHHERWCNLVGMDGWITWQERTRNWIVVCFDLMHLGNVSLQRCN